MTNLKTALAAGAVAAATLMGAATSADAATVVRHSGHGRVVTERVVHRAPTHVVKRVVVRKPIHVGGWYADAIRYHPYAYYRANQRLSACFAVTQPGFQGARHATFAATMCYGPNGHTYIVGGSRHFVRFF